MQEWHLLINDGREILITCESAEITRNGFKEITNIHWNGIKDNIPVKLDLNDCKCIYYRNLKPTEIEEQNADT